MLQQVDLVHLIAGFANVDGGGRSSMSSRTVSETVPSTSPGPCFLRPHIVSSTSGHWRSRQRRHFRAVITSPSLSVDMTAPARVCRWMAFRPGLNTAPRPQCSILPASGRSRQLLAAARMTTGRAIADSHKRYILVSGRLHRSCAARPP